MEKDDIMIGMVILGLFLSLAMALIVLGIIATILSYGMQTLGGI